MLRRVGPWKQAEAALARAGRALPRLIDDSVVDEARFLGQRVRDGIRDGAPGGRRLRALAEGTARARALMGGRGSSPLRDSGELMRSIEVIRRGDKVFAGVPADASGSDGRSLAMIARIAEEGAGPFTARATPAMRRFLAMLLGRLDSGAPSGGTWRIKIPPRPIFGPVLKAEGGEGKAGARMRRRIVEGLGEPFRP